MNERCSVLPALVSDRTGKAIGIVGFPSAFNVQYSISVRVSGGDQHPSNGNRPFCPVDWVSRFCSLDMGY